MENSNNEKNNIAIRLLATLMLLGLSACSFDSRLAGLEGIETIALCQHNEKGIVMESKIKAEYGFRRFAKDSYRPVINYQLFGHDVHVVKITKEYNKVYAAGSPMEFAKALQTITPDISCQNDSCQAPLNDGQSLLISKAQLYKVKDTTVLECVKNNNANPD